LDEYKNMKNGTSGKNAWSTTRPKMLPLTIEHPFYTDPMFFTAVKNTVNPKDLCDLSLWGTVPPELLHTNATDHNAVEANSNVSNSCSSDTSSRHESIKIGPHESPPFQQVIEMSSPPRVRGPLETRFMLYRRKPTKAARRQRAREMSRMKSAQRRERIAEDNALAEASWSAARDRITAERKSRAEQNHDNLNLLGVDTSQQPPGNQRDVSETYQNYFETREPHAKRQLRSNTHNKRSRSGEKARDV
jgi:hypothetical protein